MRRTTVSDTPYREPPPGTKRHCSRPDPDMTDEEIEAWADRFVDTVLGDVVEQESEPG
jgi:hypothetical protein